MQRKSVAAAHGVRCVRASMVLALGIGMAPAAFAYNAQIRLEAGGAAFLLERSAPADSKHFGPEIFNTSLTVPLSVHRDTSVFAGPSGGHFVYTTGAYDAWVEPGGMHLSARSYAAIDYAAMAPDADRYLRAQDGGTVDLYVSDDVTFSVAGLPQGTPFLVDLDFRVDGSFGTLGGVAGSPITPNAYASADGYWAFDLLVPGGRPPAVPPEITNHFAGAAAAGVRDDATVFNTFSTYGYPKVETVTMYANNGVTSLLELYARLTTGAFADATYLPTAIGSVDAGVYCNLSDTVSWGGIVAARQLDGTPVSLSDLSVVASSGFDYESEYVSTVPEPSAIWSISVAAASLWLLARLASSDA